MMPKLKGSHPWALILCHPSDQAALRSPGLEYFRDLIASPKGNGLNTWWRQVSGGTIDINGSNVLGWYGLSSPLAHVQEKMSRSEIAAAARAAATAAGADISHFIHTLAVVAGYAGGGAEGNDVVLGIRTTNGQAGWRWCSQCDGLAFWDGSREPGRCVAGGRHDHSGSSYYSLSHDVKFTNGQNGWRWCSKCETLCFGSATPAPCPTGGTHSFGSSADYVLRMNSAGLDEQQSWRWCKKCQALAYFDATRQPGPCPVNGRHDHSESGNYSIPLAWAASLGFLAHETGHGFGLDHAFGPSRAGNFGNDNRPGAYGDSTDIMSWDGTAKFAVPLYTPAGAGLCAPALYKLGWLTDPDTVTVVPPATPMSVTLRPLHGGTPGSSSRMIRVVVPAHDRIYTAELRTPLSWDWGIRTPRVVIHVLRTLYEAGQDGWRWCESCEGLIYAGQTVCPAGGVHDGGSSSDYGLWLNVGSSVGQTNWRWCHKCCGLFFAGSASQGICAAGGQHDGALSGDYALPLSGGGQSEWRWCRKCQGLAFAGGKAVGVCPAGGSHDYGGSANYHLAFGAFKNRQNKWRWCNKCQGLYYAGLGACKGGDIHRPVGNDFAPIHDLAGAAGQAGWRYCRKCYAMAFNDGSRRPGACPAGGSHDHTTSGNYVIPRDAETKAGQRGWRWCKNCAALTFVDSSRGPGVCSAGGKHSPAGHEYLVAHDTATVSGDTRFRWCRRCENMVLGNNPSSCKAGGNHDTSQSARYVVRTDPAPRVREEAYWRSCTKCNVLFALKSSDGSDEMSCAAGGKHAATGEYFLTFVTPDPFWRWCRRCEAMAFWDGSRGPGPCPSGGVHDHNESDFYIPPNFGLDATQVVHDNLTAGQSWSDPSNRIRFEVLTIGANNAVVRVVAT